MINATVIDMHTGDVAPDRALIIADGLITDVVDASEAPTHHAKTVIDAEGGFIIPALGDAHVHLYDKSELEIYLRYGVGVVVNMSGAPIHLEMRDGVASGRLDGPIIYTVGPTLDGTPPTNPLFTSITVEKADEIARWIAAQGYDAVKIYQQLPQNELSAILSAADAEGLLVTGHVSRIAGIDGALSAGLKFVAHGEELSFGAWSEQTSSYDDGEIPDLVKAVTERGVTVTPMVNYLENISPQIDALDVYLASEEMALVPAAMLQSWDTTQNWFSGRDEPEQFKRQIAGLAQFVQKLTAELSEAGAPLIAGTDAGFGGAIPGYSLHQELQSLTRAGLTPLEALQTATLNIGEYISEMTGRPAEYGLVAPGYRANLVLLERNPLEDISATLSIKGVMLSGKWRREEELIAMQMRLRDEQARLRTASQNFERAYLQGDVETVEKLITAYVSGPQSPPLMHADGCIFLGYKFYYGGDAAKAASLYGLCSRMHPNDPMLLIHLGRALEKSDAIDRAITAYTRADELNPWYGNPAQSIDTLSGNR